MEITYKTKKLMRICTDVKEAEKTYGERMAVKIHLRVDQICAANSIEEMVRNKIGRCHSLVNDRKGQYAMDLIHPFRLVFEKKGNEIQVANILEITDYH